MTEALNHVTPGIASEHTLFYGVEAKFYSARPQLNDHFETEIKGLYAGGDGAGVTRGLAQASACGIRIARDIVNHLNKQYTSIANKSIGESVKLIDSLSIFKRMILKEGLTTNESEILCYNFIT